VAIFSCRFSLSHLITGGDPSIKCVDMIVTTRSLCTVKSIQSLGNLTDVNSGKISLRKISDCKLTSEFIFITLYLIATSEMLNTIFRLIAFFNYSYYSLERKNDIIKSYWKKVQI